MADGPLPDHDDAHASCQVYAEAEQRWWCFGCSRGGRIYDLASLLVGGACGHELCGDAFRAAWELVVGRWAKGYTISGRLRRLYPVGALARRQAYAV